MTQKLKKAAVFACNYVISPHRIKCNTCIESFYEGLHFFFLHWWAMNNIWGHYDLEAWKFDDLTVLCAVWFTLSVLRDLFLKPWADQHLLTFKVNVKVKLDLLTVACNSSILVIILFSGRTIGIANLQNRITFSHQTQLIYGPLSVNVQCAFWCWSGLPFWI